MEVYRLQIAKGVSGDDCIKWFIDRENDHLKTAWIDLDTKREVFGSGWIKLEIERGVFSISLINWREEYQLQ